MTKHSPSLHFRSPSALASIPGFLLSQGSIAERGAQVAMLLSLPDVSLDRVDEKVKVNGGKEVHLKGVLINSKYPENPVFVPDEVIDWMVSKSILPVEIVPNKTTETNADINQDAMAEAFDDSGENGDNPDADADEDITIALDDDDELADDELEVA